MKIPGAMVAEVLRHVFKVPATAQYPFVKVDMPKDFRGKMMYFAEKCSGCGLCAKDCPSRALVINKLPDKRAEAIFDLDKCIYCGQCVDSCNRDAIAWSKNYELAALTRASLRVKFEAAPPKAPPPPKPAPAEVAKTEAPAEAAKPAAAEPAKAAAAELAKPAAAEPAKPAAAEPAKAAVAAPEAAKPVSVAPKPVVPGEKPADGDKKEPAGAS
jgi:formate hydrogenlyase subunit 6/NADH:ubiquinone oxidoreductase subunit I